MAYEFRYRSSPSVEGIVEQAFVAKRDVGEDHTTEFYLVLKDHDETFMMSDITPRVNRGEKVRVFPNGGQNIQGNKDIYALEVLNISGDVMFTYMSSTYCFQRK